MFKLSEADFRKRAGCDAIHYLRFQKLLLIRYTVGVCFFSIVMILPVNLSGNNGSLVWVSACNKASYTKSINTLLHN